jgi:hypothetical protein
MVFRSIVICILALFAAEESNAQLTTPAWLVQALSPEAKIVESANVNTRNHLTRRLVLWMINPSREVRSEPGGCSDWIYGDHWYGPVRLSLVDLAARKILNTVEIHGMYEGRDEPGRPFPIPFRVQDGVYTVPRPDTAGVHGDREGLPKILNLKDLTGEGTEGQFVLFEYEACGNYLTSAFGYDARSDRAVQYSVEVTTENVKPEVVTWIEEVFGAKPVRPGYWDFRWDPGHGADGPIHERVHFDASKRVFIKE